MKSLASLLPLLLLAACGDPSGNDTPDAALPDAAEDAASDMSPPPDDDAAPAGFGTLSAMCDLIEAMDLADPDPRLVRVSIDFERAYVDANDRPLLTEGGRRLAMTPNAGGSSGLSEIFAYEQLDRCERAMLLKTETEIDYDTNSKKTDMSVTLEGETIGVSVVRAFQFPLGTPLSAQRAREIISGKLSDILLSTASVSAADRWSKQILSVLANDEQAAQAVEDAWNGLDASVKADSIVVVMTTDGADTFIYTNQ